jgi:serine/threonine protein kinase
MKIDDDRVLSILRVNNAKAENEIILGEKLKTHGYMFFLPVVDSRSIVLRPSSQNDFEPGEPIQDYVVLNIPYIKEISFETVVQTQTYQCILLTWLDAYLYLLSGLEQLNQIGIIHFNVRFENILFLEKSFQPRIINFGMSIFKETLNEENWSTYFYKFVPEHTAWCLEIHTICYLLHETDNDLTHSDAEHIVERYMEKHKRLAKTTKDEFSEHSKQQLNSYVGKCKYEVIKELLMYSDTWDNYALSILYMQFIDVLFPTQELFISCFKDILLANIHPNPKKRMDYKKTKNEFKDLFYLDLNHISKTMYKKQKIIHNMHRTLIV